MRAQHCILSLPKFKIAAESVSVAEKMQHLGVKEIFSTHADFTPMLGQAGKSHHLDNIFHAVAVLVQLSIKNGDPLFGVNYKVVF